MSVAVIILSMLLAKIIHFTVKTNNGNVICFKLYNIIRVYVYKKKTTTKE